MGYNCLLVNRNFGVKNLFLAPIRFLVHSCSIRIIFGVSECLLYMPLAKKTDIFVFTGLGRVFQNTALRRVVKVYFGFFYRGQTVVVLNQDDKSYIDAEFRLSSSVINGEGYSFSRSIFDKSTLTPIKIAYVGRLIKSKGVDVLLEAISPTDDIDYELHLFGDTDNDSSDAVPISDIKRNVDRSMGRIKLRGFCANIGSELISMDLLVSFSLREGVPFAILDGIDAGCAIYLSDVPGHSQFSMLDGVLYGTPSEFIQFLRKLAENQIAIDFDRNERLEIANKIWGTNAVLQQILELFEREFEFEAI